MCQNDLWYYIYTYIWRIQGGEAKYGTSENIWFFTKFASPPCIFTFFWVYVRIYVALIAIYDKMTLVRLKMSHLRHFCNKINWHVYAVNAVLSYLRFEMSWQEKRLMFFHVARRDKMSDLMSQKLFHFVLNKIYFFREKRACFSALWLWFFLSK